ncbi:small ribosomal subunit Rsm22 family protein [Methanoregula sp.]|uniref:small ribosomal subunit Rsm22 family protein n=1 Tax=Methanoregula sp. TaxID=2052170 RepID=UPI00236DA429|nr:small ribosomal subunit Rsm22 family protein [Methanoregula sp.]MDD1686471.1 methyltransferase domain-containing protein [Methanoregula sp.]
MAGNTLISTIKYVAGTKPVFRLSEIIPYLDEPKPVDDLYQSIAPELARLGLVARKVGGDVEISRILPTEPFVLNTGEQERTAAFLDRKEMPAALAEAIERYITRKVGTAWDDPVILDRLRKAIVAQKDDYWKPLQKRSLRYTKGYSVLGYLAYHFPVYFMQTEHLLARLASDGMLKRSMTILDVGTGPGVVPLAIADFFSRLDEVKASVYSIERSEEHVEAFLALREAYVPIGGKVSIKNPAKADIRDPLPSSLPEKFDLIIFSNVLGELADPADDRRAEIVERIAGRLVPDGVILIIEPADEENSLRMRNLVVGLAEKGLAVHAPCPFIRGTPCTAPRCWSFATAPAIRQTRLMETLSHCEEYYRYMNTDIKYSYAVLRHAGLNRDGYRVTSEAKFPRLSKLQLHVEKRINVVVAKMSGDLGDAKNHLFKICDGTAKTPVYAVVPAFHMTPENEVIREAPYGTVLEIRGVLVRYNKEHNAYNLLVNRNTEIRESQAGERSYAAGRTTR